ncbi:nitrate reductase molybdenum cofactor assembly chaperone [Streptomyces sp. FXJ1.4098]|nr:nitrate reductase molybdenum cofactor assembly chaperone [Streptomyces sp. FXJ1.4098]
MTPVKPPQPPRPLTPLSPATPAVHQAAALLLGYPDRNWPARLTLVHDALGEVTGPGTAPLLRFCAAVRDIPVLDLAARYVVTFDRSRRRTLHLTYYTDGDTRRRGGSLAEWKARYRAHGWEPPRTNCPTICPWPGVRRPLPRPGDAAAERTPPRDRAAEDGPGRPRQPLRRCAARRLRHPARRLARRPRHGPGARPQRTARRSGRPGPLRRRPERAGHLPGGTGR